ncbi:MAG: ATP-dependent DNA helicase, partial [Nanoarchaeota archaeon]|nr:ATP-dependent DNA helicase [Nanoarchaeota archaeon]
KILKKQKILKEILKLRFRLKYGVREELLALLKLENIGRVRARRLYNQGIKDIGDVKRADVATLAQLLGKKIAIDVKKQVGQDIAKEVVPERKRKGQISLKDY